jgi:hypothetical protein
MPSLASAVLAMAPEVLGIAGSVCVSERAASTAAFSFSGVDVRDGTALLHHDTNTDARERDAAHRHEIASSVVILLCRHREDDGVERPLREFLVDIKRWSNSKCHLMAGLLFELSGNGLRSCVELTLRTRTSAAGARVDETISVTVLTDRAQKDSCMVSSKIAAVVICC